MAQLINLSHVDTGSRLVSNQVSLLYTHTHTHTHLHTPTHYTAPTSAPDDFHVVVINSTAIEVEWELPPYNSRGGIIRGYRLFVQQLPVASGGQERTITIPDNTTEGYIVGGLTPATHYRFSALAYTSVGDGPRSIHLTVATLGEAHGIHYMVCSQHTHPWINVIQHSIH